LLSLDQAGSLRAVVAAIATPAARSQRDGLAGRVVSPR